MPAKRSNIMNYFNQHASEFHLIFILGLLSGLPQSLFGTTLQAWLITAGYSVSLVSNLGLLYLVFLIRIALAPISDNFFIKTLGRRKSWILVAQLALFLCIEFLALCNPTQHLLITIFLGILLAIFSSIQDLAIDAHRIEYLKPHQFGWGAVLAVYGCRIAMLLSGGLSLIIAEHFSFNIAYACLGLFFLFGALITYFSKEPEVEIIRAKRPFLKPYTNLFNSTAFTSIFGMLFCLKFSEVFISNSSILIIPFLMKGLALSLSKIAFCNKVVGFSAQVAGGFLAAFCIVRYNIMSLILNFGLLLVASNCGFWLLTKVPNSDTLLYLVIIFENLASGLLATVLVTFLMQSVNKQYTASQFSFWIFLSLIPRIISAPLVGVILPLINWSGLFILSFVVGACFVFFWKKLHSQIAA